MKKLFRSIVMIAAGFAAGLICYHALARETQPSGYILEHEKDVAVAEPGPHDGGGSTTAYRYFEKAAGFKLAFRKRALHPGAVIGYHLQTEDEVYYIVSGTGEMTMNGKTFPVQAGDAILTRPGSSHGLKQTGKDDLVVIVNYELTLK